MSRCVQVYVAEDCAGVGTITESVKQAAQTFQKAWNEQEFDKTDGTILELKVRPAYASENNSRLREVLHSIHKFKTLSEDAKRSTPKMKVDVYGIGAPCQGFSRGGSNKGMEDKRSRPLISGYKFVKRHRPKVFILEHVPHFASLKHVATNKKLLKQLKAIGGYRITDR